MKIFEKIRLMAFAFVLFVTMAILASCDTDRNKPGWSFFNDMEKSQAYETYSVNPNLPNGKTMQDQLEGTVAIDEYAYNFVKTPEDELKAATLINPLAHQIDLKEGKKVYDQYCLLCHGVKGDGQGFLFTSKKYPYPPASYLGERAMAKTDGQLFHNIRAGFGVMGAHGSQLEVGDSWHLVNYIRHLQGTK